MRTFIGRLIEILRILWSCDRYLSSVILFLNILAGAFTIAFIYINKLILDSVYSILVKQDAARYLWRAVGLVVFLNALLLLRNFITGFQGMARGLLGAKLQRFMTERTFDRVYTTDMKHFENPEFYDKLSRAASEAGYRPMMIVQLLVSLIQSLFVFITLFVILLGISRLLVLVLALSVIPSIVIEKRMRRLSFDTYLMKTPSQRKMGYINFLFTGVSSIRELKVFRLGEFLKDEYARHFRENYRLDKRLALQQTAFALLVAGVSVASSLYAYIFALLGVLGRRFGIGDFSFVVQSFGQCQGQVEAIIDNIYSLYENNLFISNYFEFQALPSEIENPEPVLQAVNTISGAAMTSAAEPSAPLSKADRRSHNLEAKSRILKVPEKIESLRLENVSFCYPGFDRFVLKNLDLTLRAGETTALLGDNGAGKTTVLKLLCRFYDPLQGAVYLNDTDIRGFDLVEYRKRIGIVFQDFMRYYFTACENIVFGAPWLMDGDGRKDSTGAVRRPRPATYNENARPQPFEASPSMTQLSSGTVQRPRPAKQRSTRKTGAEGNRASMHKNEYKQMLETAAQASGADGFIDRLPSGYSTLLGRLFEGGSEISYGEWQKLGLSRALFGGKDIILLDEPFSHQYHAVLDRFFDYVSSIRNNRICLLITHDPTIASRADRVITLKAPNAKS